MDLNKIVTENWGYIQLAALLLVLLAFFAFAYSKVRSMPRSARSAQGSFDFQPILYISLQILLILVLGILLSTFSKDSEIQLGFLVVIAVVALIALLFSVASGFAGLQLTDPKQALVQ